MKYLVVMLLALSGCGDSSRDNELVGQVKKVKKMTPIICPNWTAVDVSLGIMRNGTGSMSSQDVWLTVDNKEDQARLTKAAESGLPVKITYDARRFAFCTVFEIVSKVEILK